MFDYLTAFSKFIGIPQRRNPPTRSMSLSLSPSMASAGVLHIFAKLKKGLCKILWNILIFELLLTSKLLLI
jgi:hypothetical protein